MIDPVIIYYGTIAFVIALTSFGGSIGGAWASTAALQAIDIQPSARSEIIKISIIGLALIETAAILGLLIALLLLVGKTSYVTLPMALSNIGIAVSLGITGCISGIVSSYPVRATCFAIARQPFFSQQLLNIMIITQTIIQTPLIFVFLTALFITYQITTALTLKMSLILLSCGLSIGLGSIGPSFGLGRFAAIACSSVGLNRKAYPSLMPFTLISGAFIETPLIFAFILSLLLIGNLSSNDQFIGIRSLCAAICIGIGTFSPGLSSSKTAQAACIQIARNPENASLVSQVSMFTQGIIDAAAVYSLLTALFILFLK